MCVLKHTNKVSSVCCLEGKYALIRSDFFMYKNISHPRGRPFAGCLECPAGSRSLHALCDVNGSPGEPLAFVWQDHMLEHVPTFPQSSCEDLVQLVYAVACTLLAFLILYLSFSLFQKQKTLEFLVPGSFEVWVCCRTILCLLGPWFYLIRDHYSCFQSQTTRRGRCPDLASADKLVTNNVRNVSSCAYCIGLFIPCQPLVWVFIYLL